MLILPPTKLDLSPPHNSLSSSLSAQAKKLVTSSADGQITVSVTEMLVRVCKSSRRPSPASRRLVVPRLSCSPCTMICGSSQATSISSNSGVLLIFLMHLLLRIRGGMKEGLVRGDRDDGDRWVQSVM